MIIKTEISDDALVVLKMINKKGRAEFKDSEYINLDAFKKSTIYNTETANPEKKRDDAWFRARNFCDLDMLTELTEHDLIDLDYACSTLTYILTEKGKKILAQFLEEQKNSKLIMRSAAYFGPKEDFREFAIQSAVELDKKQKAGKMLDVRLFIVGTVGGVVKQQVFFIKSLPGETLEETGIRAGMPIKKKD